MNKGETIPILNNYFKQKNNILLAYLFGSAAKNNSFHDIDIAVLVDNLQEDRRLSIQVELECEIKKLINYSKKVDIIILNDASLLLKYEVIKNGIVIFEKSEDIRCEFEVKNLLYFYDFEPMREYFTKCTIERIKKW